MQTENITADNFAPELLPPVGRWVRSRKGKLINLCRDMPQFQDKILERYGISEAEYSAWCRLFDKNGLLGLQSTRMQHFYSRMSKPSYREACSS